MNKKVELSGRMQAVADLVSPGNRVCDVGCDHGYISIYLVQSGISPYVLAMDVNRGPLSKAAEHVKKFQTEEYITLRLSDGLSAYRKGEADTFLCGGLGGRLLMDILKKEPEKTADFKEFVLQPQSEIPLFRKFLREEGYQLLKEDMIYEDGKFYPMIKAAPGRTEACLTPERQELEDNFGPILLAEKHPVLLQYIRKEISVKQALLDRMEALQENDRNRNRKNELRHELALFRKAETLWG
jgi:tRNA (adenine22-N1)-methyltransferase